MPVKGIVGGSNHAAARRAKFLDVVRNRGSRSVGVSEQHRNSCASKHLRNHPSGAIGSEARIVADDDAARVVFILEDVASDRARNAPDIIESKVVGNEAAPAVGAEFNLCHWRRWSFGRSS